MGGVQALMSEVKSYRDLIVWQKAMDLVVESYLLSEKLPKRESYGLISDIRKAVSGVRFQVSG
jgi:hypothetical protein